VISSNNKQKKYSHTLSGGNDISRTTYLQGGTIALKLGLEKPSLFSGMILLGPAVKPNPETATTFKVRLIYDRSFT